MLPFAFSALCSLLSSAPLAPLVPRQVTRRRMEIASARAAASANAAATADGAAHSALHRQLSLGAAERFANMKRWDQTDHPVVMWKRAGAEIRALEIISLDVAFVDKVHLMNSC